jgi:hypothetical protein
VDVVASTAAFAICYSLIGVVRQRSAGGFAVLDTMSWGVFLAFFFILVSVVIYVPILASSQRLLPHRSRASHAVLGAFLFPVPMLAFPLLQGRLEIFGRHLMRDPLVFVATALPYIVAGALLGWLLAAPRHDVRQGI